MVERGRAKRSKGKLMFQEHILLLLSISPNFARNLYWQDQLYSSGSFIAFYTDFEQVLDPCLQTLWLKSNIHSKE